MPVRFPWLNNAVRRNGVLPKFDPFRTNKKRRESLYGLSRGQLFKALGSFLVPLLIGIFTIVTTIQQYQISHKNRLKDLEIATRERDQEQEQADILNQETVYAVFIKDMGELSLQLKTENGSSTELDHLWKLARGKTLSALRQLDAKRKGYLIQFLFDAELILSNRSAIDLGGADLSGMIIPSHTGRQYMYDFIALTHVVLTNVSFFDLHLMKANFTGSLLDNTNFSKAYLYQTNFIGCDLKNADLRGIQVQFAIMVDNDLSGAIYDTLPEKISNLILPNGSFVFYSNNTLKSDLFNESKNLIINGDIKCQTNIDSKEILGWIAYNQPVAIIEKYSQLPLFLGNIREDDCVLSSGTQNSSIGFLHQRVYFNNYTRLISSGRASYEFSFDSGGINAYNGSFHLAIGFRALNGQSLGTFRFRKYT